MSPTNHKTVFVLDHTPYFGISCDSPIEFDTPNNRQAVIVPLKPISKSLWTCSVESSIEYCRIVWDLFPTGKLIRFVVSDTAAHILNTWSPQQQNLTFLMNAMAMVGIPPRQHSAEFSVVHGLRAAIEALSECSEIQHERRTDLSFTESHMSIQNNCRVICITSARDDGSMKRIEDIFLSYLQQQNKLAAGTDHLLTIDSCHLVIINIFPNNTESQVTNHPFKSVSPILRTEVHSIKAPLIASKLSHLILNHYDLASTTVTGIPMKEEQNASSSANYDVEIYHSSKAHTAILKGNAADSNCIRSVREGSDYETITLKWCTPRGNASEIQNCTAMYRITAVDLNSRPSSCLINFLLGGRFVMLEMPRKSGGKMISHMLASHGGEIFIHTLCTARQILEDPPSISEGCGGRVTDYRITDFGSFIQSNKLIPLKKKKHRQNFMDRMQARLGRQTKYWPMTISSTLIFNLKSYVDPLPSLIVKEQLTEDEVEQCKQKIYSLIALESKHESLHLPNAGHRTKGQKKEEQYKILWNELETLLKSNCRTESHTTVYNCLLECHKFGDDDKSDKVELDQALRELDQIENEPVDKTQRASVIRATTDSPMSPPPLASINTPLARSSMRSSSIYSSPKSLLDIYIANKKKPERPDFFGRASGLVVKLYPNLKLDNDRGPRADASIEQDG